jgi:hypothetical protein
MICLLTDDDASITEGSLVKKLSDSVPCYLNIILLCVCVCYCM